ncbi:hypothetical protein D3I35_10405 [Enterococcus faecium]|nr:hypothetical protein [Enterococcus faecium]MBE6166282.1 hypothetical protein [Enterococcus faecium]
MFNQLLLGNKPTSLEKMKSYFLTSALITQSITLISQPLIHGVPEVASSEISSYFLNLTTSVTTSSAFIFYFFPEPI